jgi:hypothetical protein
MFYRRKLPHWHPELAEATFLFVNWRLAGCIARGACRSRQWVQVYPRAEPSSSSIVTWTKLSGRFGCKMPE